MRKLLLFVLFTVSIMMVAQTPTSIGQFDYTTYDLQTNAGAVTRTIVWPDGKISFAYCHSSNTNYSYSDRGTAIGTYDGVADQWFSTGGRVENEKTGFGSIARFGENGIVVAAHTATQCGVYIIEDRDNIAANSASAVSYLDNTYEPLWPNVMTSGEDRSIIHIVANAQSGSSTGLNNQLYYYRSQDGGQTWDKKNVILPYTGPDYCGAWSSNNCYWMETTEDNCLALVVNNPWSDGMVIYSYDNGETWNRKVFYQHPNPFGDFSTTANILFYPRWVSCQWDSNHKLHVLYEYGGKITNGYFPQFGGVAYWNEDMPYNENGNTQSSIPGNLTPGQPFVLDSAYLHNDIHRSSWWNETNVSHEMWPEYIGYLTPLDDNGNVESPYASTSFGIEDRSLHGDYAGSDICAFPVLCKIPETENGLLAIWAGLDENNYDINGNYYYKIFASFSNDGGAHWTDMVHLTNSAFLQDKECIFPQAAVVNNQLVIVCQMDGMTGLYTRSEDDDPSDNYYGGMVFDLEDLFGVVTDNTVHVTAVANPFSGGYFTGTGWYPIGSFCELTAEPNVGYAFSNWMKDGEVISTDSTYGFIVNEDCEYIANFIQVPFDISASVFPLSGGIVSGTGMYYQGDTCTLTASSSEGYTFMYWAENGEIVSFDANYSFVVSGSRNLEAYFTLPICVRAMAEPNNGGAISGNGYYDYGTECTLTATAFDGFSFVNWTENGEFVSMNDSYSFVVTSERNLVANFMEGEMCAVTFDLFDSYGDGWNGNKLVVTSDNGGYYEITLEGNASGSQTLLLLGNSHITLSWIMGGWTEECSFAIHYQNGYLIYEGHNLSENFAFEFDIDCSPTVTVTAESDPIEGGVVTGGGEFDYGNICTLNAIPNEGYVFLCWTKNGERVSSEKEYSFVANEDGTYIAVFVTPLYPDENNIVYVKPYGCGTADGSSWENAIGNLQLALDYFNLQQSKPTIWVATGTYYGDSISTNAFTMAEGVNVYGGFAGNEPADYDLNLRDFEANETVLDGQHVQRVLNQPVEFDEITVWDGFSIKNGYNDYVSALYIQRNTMIKNCVISNNHQPSDNHSHTGYALFVSNASVVNCKVVNNVVNGWYYAIIAEAYNTLFDNCLVGNNTCGGDGIGFTASNCVFNNIDFVNNDLNRLFGGQDNYFRNCIIWGNGHIYNNYNGEEFSTAVLGEDGYSQDNSFDHCAIESNDLIEGNNIVLLHENIGEGIYHPRFENPSPTIGVMDSLDAYSWQLLEGSICINQGDTTGLNCPEYDLAGNQRIQQGRIDIGCYESPYNGIYIPSYNGIVYVTPTGSGNNDGSSWENATSSITLAMDISSANGDIDIWVAAGVYYGDSIADNSVLTLRDGISIYGGFSGNEPFDYDLSLRDFENNATILDGQNVQRVLFQEDQLGNQIIFDGFVIRNGRVSSYGNYGGGAYLVYNTILKNVVFENNGQYALCLSGVSNAIDKCIFRNNYDGGGIYTNNPDNVTITNCLINNNEGIGINHNFSYYEYGTYRVLNIINCTVVNNSGYGIDRNSSSWNGTSWTYNATNILNCIIWGNGEYGEQLYGGNVNYCAVQDGYDGEGNIALCAGNEGNTIFYPRFQNPSPTRGVIDSVEMYSWTLMENSICINHGDTTGVLVDDFDLAGNLRIQHERIDIGCYESSSQGVEIPSYDDSIVYVTPDGAGSRSGNSWENAMSNISDAMETAKAMDSLVVWVAAGIYYGDSVPEHNAFEVHGVSLYGGFVGNEPYDYDLSLRDFETNASILDGQSVQRVLFCGAYMEETLVDGFTISNGFVNGNGAGVYTSESCIIKNCIIRECHAQGNGGGIYLGGASILENSRVFNNVCVGKGGGVCVNYAELVNCRIDGNTSDDQGGGVYMYDGTIESCLVADNISYDAGGVFINRGIVRNCNIINNSATSISDVPGGLNTPWASSGCSVSNTIIWGNKKNGYINNTIDRHCFSYCAIEGMLANGTGNINLASDNDGLEALNYVRFVDVENNNFQLQVGSACIEAGDPETTTLDSLDLAGNQRIKHDRIDIGCYEFNGEYGHIISVYSSPIEAGVVNGGGRYQLGDTCTLTAIPNEDYVFVNWTEDDEVVCPDPEYTFTVTSDREIVANFRYIRHTVSIEVNPTNGGTVTVSGENVSPTSLLYDFEDHSFKGWTQIDADGDGRGWSLGSSVWGSTQGHDGSSDMVVSASYDNNAGPLTPDNYLVSPQVVLGGQITFYACAQDASYAAEHFGVAISTTGNTNPADFTTIQEWTITRSRGGNIGEITRSGNRTQGTWYEYTVDLTAYTGNGYVAIRHFGCTDMWYLDIDDISIINNSQFECLEGQMCTLTALPNEGFRFVNWSNSGIVLSDSLSYSFMVTNDTIITAVFTEYVLSDTSIYADICQCNDYLLNGFEIIQPEVGESEYSITLPSSQGTDSIVNLTLTVHPAYFFAEDTTLCNTTSFEWHGHTYTESGIYYDTLQTTHGCDSVFQLSLEMFNTPLGEFSYMTPTNNYPFTSLPITFSWDAVSGAEYYDLYVWDVEEQMPEEPLASSLIYSNYSTSALQNYHTYNWLVKARNACNEMSSSVKSFYLDITPSLNVNVTHIDFGEVAMNQSTSTTLSVTGIVLEDALDVQITGDDAAMFSFTQASGWNDYNGGILILTFNPTTPQFAYDASLVVSSGTLTKTVSLIGAVSNLYTFNTYVAEDVYAMNTLIPIYGSVIDWNNTPVADAEVEIGVFVMGMKRTLQAMTDANGQFSAVFEPMSSESGYYTVNSGRVGNNSTVVHDEFNIPGMAVVTSDYILCAVTQDQPKTDSILIRNKSNLPLNNIQLSTLSAPEGCSFSFSPLNLGGLEEDYLVYTVTGSTLSQGNYYEEVRLKAMSSEGAETFITVWYYCMEPKGVLDVAPKSLATTMTIGKNKIVDVMLTNNGTAATGNVYIDLPNVEWMSVVGNDTLSSIAVNDTAYFSLRLSPAENIQLGQYSGTIAINSERGDAVALPYTITAVSDSTGTLMIDVTDDFTWNTNNGNGPHLEGAEVRLKGYYSLETVAYGFTDADGHFRAENLPEGYYRLSVTAERHTDYNNVVFVEAGATDRSYTDVYLQYQAITYSFTAVPTEIVDEYTYEFNVVYETNVPVPVVVIETPDSIPSFDESYSFNYVITNHGLIDALDLTLHVPVSENYLFTALYDHVDTLHALTTIVIPCVVTHKSSRLNMLRSNCAEWGYTWTEYTYKCHKIDGTLEVKNMSGFVYTLLGNKPCDPPTALGGGVGGFNAPLFGIVGGHGSFGNPFFTSPLLEMWYECDNGCVNMVLWGIDKILSSVPLLNYVYKAGKIVYNTATILDQNIDDALVSIYDLYKYLSEMMEGIYDVRGVNTYIEYLKIAKEAKAIKQNITHCYHYLSGDRAIGSDNDYDLIPDEISHMLQFEEEYFSAASNTIDFLMMYFNDSTWLYSDINELNSFMDVLFEYDSLYGRVDIDSALLSLKPSNITDNHVIGFVERYNNTKDFYNGNVVQGNNYIPIDSIASNVLSIINRENEAILMGYESGADRMNQLTYSAYDYLKANKSSSVCAKVGIQFSQKMTMTREAFEGTVTIHNGHDTDPMQAIDVEFVVRDSDGNDCTNLFQINTLSLNNITGIDGTGSIDAGMDGVAIVHFIPTKQAAPTEPKVYYFGGHFTFIDPFTEEELLYDFYPVEITVNPSPDLHVDYFMQRDILGDDALTEDIVEPSVPATLGVIINNKGAGLAKNVTLETAEPQIIDNEKGLAIDFAMCGASFNGSPRQLGLMAIPFGNIESGHTAVGEWLFTSSLLGHFVSYDAHVIHNSSYGNSDLSLVSHLDIHELIHPICAYGHLDDGINDFLVNDNPDAYDTPDSIYFSHGGKTSVGVVDGISFDHYVEPLDSIITLTVNPSRIGWNYGVVDDPGRDKYELVSCTRNNDGQVIPLSNVWQTFVTIPDGGDPVYENKLHIVDTLSNDVQDFTYTLVYSLKSNLLDILEITGIPENSIDYPLESFVVKFNESIIDSTFTYEDMTLKCQNGPNLMDSTIVITKVSDSIYEVNIATLTYETGLYVLNVNTLSIKDKRGFTGYNGKQVNWVQTWTNYTQTDRLDQGWNWWSTYIDMSTEQDFDKLKTALGSNATMIKSRTDGFVSYYDGWYGTLNMLSNTDMYMINMNSEQEISIFGPLTDLSGDTIGINPGWNWIGYPTNKNQEINAALVNLAATDNDMLKSRNAFASYYSSLGWVGSLNVLTPSDGYMYYSNRNETFGFVYGSPTRNNKVPQPFKATNHWEVSVGDYDMNATVIGVIEINGEEQRDDKLVLGAFIGDRCVGQTNLIRIEAFDRYLAFLTYFGNENDEITFRLYDEDNDVEYGTSETTLVFAPNAMIGTIDNPLVISFATMGLNDACARNIKLFPNPVAANQKVRVVLNEALSSGAEVELITAMGVELVNVKTNGNVLELTAPKIPGFYIVRVTDRESNAYYGKMIVE